MASDYKYNLDKTIGFLYKGYYDQLSKNYSNESLYRSSYSIYNAGNPYDYTNSSTQAYTNNNNFWRNYTNKPWEKKK